MTISTTASRVAYDGDGATVAFAVPFPFFAAVELEVIERDAVGGAETAKVLDTDYTVAGGNGGGGTVTAVVAPPSTVQWVIRRKTARTQSTDYTPNDPFPAETHEKALDRLTMMAQELGEESDRALKFPKTDAAGLSPTLPASVARAGRVLAFDGDGVPTVSGKSLTQLESEADDAAVSAGSASASASAAAASATNAAESATGAAASAAAAGNSATEAASFAEKNVKSYGAKGDGVTDDTAAFTTAIAASAGGVLVVPEGTFIVSGITIDVALELRIREGGTVKLKNASNANVITISHSDVIIRGAGCIDGNRANQSAGSQHGIFSSVVDRVFVDGLFLTNCGCCGAQLKDGDDLIIRNCRITLTGDTGAAILCTTKSTNRGLIENNIVDRSDSAANNQGCCKFVNNSGGTTFVLRGCRIKSNRVKMHATPSGSGVVPCEIWADAHGGNVDCAIVGNYIDGGTISASFNAGLSGTIANNTIYNANTTAAELADSDYCSVIGNIIDGGANGSDGIALNKTTTMTHAIVSENTLRSIGRAIYVSCSNAVISNNNIFNCTAEGIEINGPGNDGAVISNNLIDTTIQNPGNAGIVTINNSNIIITGNYVNCVGNAVTLLANSGTRDNLSVHNNVVFSSAGGTISFNGTNFGNHVQVMSNPTILQGAAAVMNYEDAHNGVVRLYGNDDPQNGFFDEDAKGSTYYKRDGAPGQTLCVKLSAAGSPGWLYVNMTQCVEITVTAAQLASGAKFALVAAAGGARWKMRNIKLTGITSLSGGGGDRNVRIQDNSGAVIWSTMTAAAVQGTTPLRWGDAGLPFDSANSQTAQSTTGDALVAMYQGGTTDYTVGSITLILEYERTT